MLSVHFATSEVDSPSGPPMLSTRLRDLAGSLLQLANAHEQLVLALEPASRTPSADGAHLRAELGRMRGNIETLLSSLVEVSDQLRRRDVLA